MKKSFYSNLAFLLFVNLLVKPFWIFGIDRSVQNADTVGTETYGMYFSLFGAAFLFQVLLDFGITNYNNRAVAQQDKDFVAKNLANILILKFSLTLAYALLIFCLALFLQYDSRQTVLLALVAATQVLSSFLLYARSNISGLHLFRVDSVLSVLDRLLMIASCGFLLWGPYKEHFIIDWFVYCQIGSLLITLIIAAAIVFAKTQVPQLNWDFAGVKDILKKTYPYALLGLLMSVYYRVDGVMIERLLPDGAHEAGIYAASYRLLDAANNMMGVLFAAILLPMFARMISKKENVQSLAASSFMLIMSGALVVVGICVLFRQEIMELLYPQSTLYWTEIFGLLMPSFFGICTVYIYGTLLTANGSLKVLNSIALGGMLLNIVLNLFLIPEYKALGATVATLITQTIVGVAHYVAARIVMRDFKTASA